MLTNSLTRYERPVTKFRLRCATKLKNNPTKTELRAIEILKSLGIDYEFNYLIKRYIVDFYIPSKNMIIELDGFYHKKQKRKDMLRDSFLWRNGYKVHRLWNSEVEKIPSLFVSP